MEDPENSGGVNDHHRHGSSRGDVPGIVHVEDGNRCEHGFRRVEEDYGGNGGHGVEEEVTAHVQQGRQADGQCDLTDCAQTGVFSESETASELRVQLLQCGEAGQVADGVKVNDGADHQDAHGAVEKAQGVVRMVEEENIGNTEDESGNGKRKHCSKVQQGAKP